MAAIDNKTLSAMKVAELKEELKSRGLDTKGTKPILLKRLKEAIEQQDGAQDEADESIDYAAVDTTTEEMDDSITGSSQSQPDAEPESQPDLEAEPEAMQQEDEDVEQKAEPVHEVEAQPVESEVKEAEPTKVEADVTEEQAADESTEVSAAKTEMGNSEEKPVSDEVKEDGEQKTDDVVMETGAAEQNGDEQAVVDFTADIPGGFAVVDEVGDTGGESRDREERHRRRRSRSRSPRSRSPRDRRRTRSRSRDRRRRSRSPPYHRQQQQQQQQQQQAPPQMDNDDWLTDTNVQLDKYNSDLNLTLEADNKCHPMSKDGFAWMWAGVRATYGLTQGKVAYEVKIIENQSVGHLPEEETNPHVVRVGFSTDACDLQLGEVSNSFGYGGTGKASENCKFKDFGESFGKDDVITSYVDFEGPAISMSYSKNGTDLGECFSVPHEKLAGVALFPHVLTKNCEFQCNFGQNEEAWFPLKEGFTFINSIPVEERSRASLPPEKKEDCEMLMMCGLPGAGKTVWAGKHAQEFNDKKFYVLGTNNIIDKMKVMGLPRKRNYAGRWDVLIDKSTKCLNNLFHIAARKKRNYILDQTNVYPSAQRRKMRPFEGFQRKAIVIVPTDEEFKARIAKREKEEGKDVPDKAVLEMKANFQIPEQGSLFDLVEFIELDKEEATKLIEEYNKEGRAACPPREKVSRFSSSNSSSINVSGGRGRYGGGGGGGGGNDRRYDSRDRYDRRDDRRGGDKRYGGGERRDYNNRSGGGSGGGYRSGGGGSYDRNRGGSSHHREDRNRGYSDRSYGAGSSSSSATSNYTGSSSYGGYGSSSGYGSGGYGQTGWGQGAWAQSYAPAAFTGYSQTPSYGQGGYGSQYQQYWQGYQQQQPAAAASQQQYGQWYGYGQQTQPPKK